MTAYPIFKGVGYVDGVRRLRESDIPELGKILSKSHFNQSERREIKKQIQDYFHNPEGDVFRTFVYRVGRTIVGFICFGTDCGEDTYEISFLCVHPRHQRNGVASKLLGAAEEYVRKKGGRIMFLYTSSSREYVPARLLYQKNGYIRTSVIKDFFNDGENKIIYSKRLKLKRKLPG